MQHHRDNFKRSQEENDSRSSNDEPRHAYAESSLEEDRGAENRRKNNLSPYKRKVDKIFEKLHNRGRNTAPARSKERPVNVKQRFMNMHSAYRQTLSRDMFMRQREYTDRVYRKCIQGERRRLIKSANRRNPRLVASAV